MTSLNKEVQGLKEQLVEAQTERDEAKKQISSHSESIMIMKKDLREKVHLPTRLTGPLYWRK